VRIDENGYISSGWKIAICAAALVAVVALTIVTCGAGSIVGTIVISGAINIVAQAATVAIAQSQYSKVQGDSKEEINKDTVDAVADSLDTILGNNISTKMGTSLAFWSALNAIPSIYVSWEVACATGTSFGEALFRGGMIGYAKSTVSIAGAVVAYGFSAYYVGSAIWSCFDQGYAYDLATQYGWIPR
jgi:hypothetical protein